MAINRWIFFQHLDFKLVAIDRFYRVSIRLRCVKINKNKLLGSGFGIVLIEFIFLLSWTIVDPCNIKKKYETIGIDQKIALIIIIEFVFIKSK